MKIVFVIGARPNFIKAAPLISVFKDSGRYESIVIHTGQHYDHNMSSIFVNQLNIDKPDFNLNVGPGSHAKQTANIMIKFEKIINDINPDWIFVFGDVNSTFAAAIVGRKLNINVAHVESGLRSFDLTMPEEINRILTDRISDLLFVTENSGIINLKMEGISEEKILFVGNTMIDTIINMKEQIDNSSILNELNLKNHEYIIVTLHRPTNVDSTEKLSFIINKINDLSKNKSIIWPVHPRVKIIKEKCKIDNWTLLNPLGYIDFLKLMKHSSYIFTDSGGIQEESSHLNVPCFTLRNNTERPITCELGTNIIINDAIFRSININEFNSFLSNINLKTEIPLWDGNASKRIITSFKHFTSK